MKSKDKERLIREAGLVKVNSYSPYSKFRVGAALLLTNGEVISGTNVESCSYPCGICAERNVLSTAYGKGFRKADIVALAISADTKDFITPCGMCAQVISELMDAECPIFLLNSKNEIKEIKVRKLLPYYFSLEGSK